MAANKIKVEKKIKVKRTRFDFRILREHKPLLIILFIISISLVILAGCAIYFVVIPARKVTTAVENISNVIGQLGLDLESKDLSKLDKYVTETKIQLDVINAEVARYDFLKDLTVTKGYYQNLQVLREISDKSQLLITDILPELKIILSAAGYHVDSAANIDAPVNDDSAGEGKEQIQGLIRELPRVISLYEEVESQINDIIDTFNRLDPTYIPNIGTAGYREKVIQVQDLTRNFPMVSAQAKDLLSVLPTLLGSETPSSYLIVYQNEKEMRASGGLLSAYGNLVIDKGELGDDISATDMWDLEGYTSWTLGKDVGYRNIYGQNALMNFGCGSSYLRAQDSGIYPDLNVSLGMFKDYYDLANKNNPKKYPAYQHIIILNTFFASDIISLVEPLDVEGQIITSENAAKVIFGETSSQPLDPAIRKEFIGKVATVLKDKFYQLSADDFPRIVQMLIRTAQQKNIAFYSRLPEVQEYFDQLGISGRIEKTFDGDYFHFNEAQNCALKSNFYVYDIVTQNIVIDELGNIKKDIGIEWVNEKVYDPKEPFIISSSGFFRYRAWVRFFMPEGSKVTKSDGLEKSYYFYKPVEYFDQKMQKQISDNVIIWDHRRLRPQDPIRRWNLNVSYSLPESLRYSEQAGYRMLIQKHPGKRAEKYLITINDKGALTTVEFNLDRDKVLTYRSGVISIENFDTRLDQYYDLMETLKPEQPIQ